MDRNTIKPATLDAIRLAADACSMSSDAFAHEATALLVEHKRAEICERMRRLDALYDEPAPRTIVSPTPTPTPVSSVANALNGIAREDGSPVTSTDTSDPVPEVAGDNDHYPFIDAEILQCVRDGLTSAKMIDLSARVSALSLSQIQRRLSSMRDRGIVEVVGKGRASRWVVIGGGA